MLFRQLFDKTSSTYTYLMASRRGGEALLIDPVFEQTNRYLKLLEELDLKLVKVVDTHIHADHVSAMGSLRDATRCTTVMGEQSPADVVSLRVRDGEAVTIEGMSLTALHTPGHTSESYSFLMDDRVFTGDTLFIRGTGRTDFQGGSSQAQFDSIFNKLLTFVGRQPDRFFAEDVFARLERSDRPRHMEVIRQRVIDCIDFRTGHPV